MSDLSAARRRAVSLLEEFFARDGPAERRAVFERAFGGMTPDPSRDTQFDGKLGVFASETVEQLCRFGCAGRREHSLSRLIDTMAKLRGRQTNPDYADLPREFNACCELPTREEEQRYLARLIEAAEERARLYAPLQGKGRRTVRTAGDEAKRLRPWRGQAEIEVLLRHVARKREQADQHHEGQSEDYSDILTAFGRVPRAALLGPPGSGKSTTLRKLAVDLAAQAQKDASAPVPLLVSLGSWLGDEPLARFLEEKASPEIGWAVEALSRAGRLVLLLDGLNEMPTATRAVKAQEVCALHGKLSAATPVIVSCRREDYTGDLDLGLDHTLSLEPLSPRRVRTAVRQWMRNSGESEEEGERFFWQLAGDEQLAGVLKKWIATGGSEDSFWAATNPQDNKEFYQKSSGAEDELLRKHVPNPRSLLRLAANPFMLTMLYNVWGALGELPRNRGELFSGFIRSLLSREGLLDTPAGDQLLAGLSELAWQMQRERIDAAVGGGGDDFGVLTVTSHLAAVAVLGGSEELLKKALDGTLIEETGSDLRFRHQLLQEYFTAQALARRLAATKAEELWPPGKWWERSGWEEAAVLLAGLAGDDCSGVVRWLAQAQPAVAVQCIEESGAGLGDRAKLLSDLQAGWMPRLLSEPRVEARAAVGRALGRLGLDARQGVGLRADGVPDIEWVEIPGGEFLYQEESKARSLPAFRMAKYPVTNTQYNAFLEAVDGHGEKRWWTGLAEQQRDPASPGWSEGNHPRERVSWYEAMAYCGWLSSRLGYEVRLPTEWEWERAARGRKGRMYPWGEEWREHVANTAEGGIGRTTAVGIYPEGRSVEGVLDLSGNVWEWCLNEYEKPERVQRSGEEPRVLRGGSWRSFQDDARADYRDRVHPLDRLNVIGFRLVSSSPIH